jgi:two-component system, chemotaxis family, sensor kinase CheA
LLTALSDGLDQMTPDAIDTENMNAVFRAVHSMKGGGGAFGLDDLVSFAHTFETVLDQLRSNKLTMTPDILNVLLTEVVPLIRTGLRLS